MKKGLAIGIIALLFATSVTSFVGSINIDNSKDYLYSFIPVDEDLLNKSDDVDWWSMFKHDLNNSGYSTSVSPNVCILNWTFATGDVVRSSPAVVDGKIYFGSYDNNFYCLDSYDGSLIWSYETGDEIFSPPSIVDCKVYFGSSDFRLYCLDADNGSLIWFTEINFRIWDAPAVANGKVYIGSLNDDFYCFDADNGSLIWVYPTIPWKDESSPAVFDGRVYFGSSDFNFYCLDADNGSLLWTYTADDWADCPPAIADDKVYFGSHDDNLYCLDAYTGSLLWYYTASSWVNYPSIAYGRVYVGSYDGILYCLDSDTGSLLWDYTTNDQVLSSPAIADGKVYVGSYDDIFYCLDAYTGSLLWSYQTGDWISGSPSIADGKVYIGSHDGKVYCFRGTDENEISDIDCLGTLNWIDVQPGSTVESRIIVSNVGDVGSLLDWEIKSFPEWGTWTFDPEFGIDLLAGDYFTINIEVIAPNDPNEEFTGEIVIINSENDSDNCVVDVSLVTPVYHPILGFPFLDLLKEKFPLLYELIQKFTGCFI